MVMINNKLKHLAVIKIHQKVILISFQEEGNSTIAFFHFYLLKCNHPS